MIATPDYDDLVTELGDPNPVLVDITEATEAELPKIEEAHRHD